MGNRYKMETFIEKLREWEGVSAVWRVHENCIGVAIVNARGSHGFAIRNGKWNDRAINDLRKYIANDDY